MTLKIKMLLVSDRGGGKLQFHIEGRLLVVEFGPLVGSSGEISPVSCNVVLWGYDCQASHNAEPQGHYNTSTNTTSSLFILIAREK